MTNNSEIRIPQSALPNIARLLISCADQKGIVAVLSNFIFEHGGNIIQSDQHSTNYQNGQFFMRLEFSLENFDLSPEEFGSNFQPIADRFHMYWQINYTNKIKRIGFFVSKEFHCLIDLLWRWKSGELSMDIPFLISNHSDAEKIANDFEIDFYHFPVNKNDKPEQENKVLDLIKGKADFLVLARYMQILSKNFIEHYQHKIINIHHSFLPAFAGAKPYQQAQKRGVKIIGATAHYATCELDQGPIIEQDIIRVSHKDSLNELQQKGHDIERTVLARAVKWQIEDRIIVYKNKTIVFV
ncbi:MAG: formyltetrahydrofolate deformylase [Candidatus Margulisiibacteriota bacterium]